MMWIFLDVNWGSSTQAQTYKTALTSVHKLVNVNEHVKNYRPQILVLTGKPQDRPPLVDLANLITKNSALMMCGHVVQVNWFPCLSFKMEEDRAFDSKCTTLRFHVINSRAVAATDFEYLEPFLI
jgi:solute carrier family 12 sodium/potassium/chloride transporter 2